MPCRLVLRVEAKRVDGCVSVSVNECRGNRSERTEWRVHSAVLNLSLRFRSDTNYSGLFPFCASISSSNVRSRVAILSHWLIKLFSRLWYRILLLSSHQKNYKLRNTRAIGIGEGPATNACQQELCYAQLYAYLLYFKNKTIWYTI